MNYVLFSMCALILGGFAEDSDVDTSTDSVLKAIFADQANISTTTLTRQAAWLSEPKQTIRGQSGGVYETPPMTAPMGASPYPVYQPSNPFATPSDPVLPYLGDQNQTILSGINGPQPHRLGFTPLFDATYIVPSSAKSPGNGRMSVQEYDAALRHTSLIGGDWAFTNTLQGGVRLWDGPQASNLPGSVFRLGWDFLLNTPNYGPWSMQFDFNPSINTDLHASLYRQAFNFDGNITAFYQMSPQLLLVLGVQYWDRVDKLVLPSAGVVWNPNDRLEMRILFPKSRISYFLGTLGDGAHWLYGTAEYHVESYQIDSPGVSDHEQVQLSDWRFGIGLRSDHTWYDKYVEVGYVLGRQVDYLRSTPDFNLNDGFMVRAGVRF